MEFSVCSWGMKAKPTTMQVIEGGETTKKPGGEQCEFQLLEGNILYSEALGHIA